VISTSFFSFHTVFFIFRSEEIGLYLVRYAWGVFRVLWGRTFVFSLRTKNLKT